MTNPPPPPPPEEPLADDTLVAPPARRRMVVDEGYEAPPPPPVRPYPWWLWGLAGLFLAAAIVFLVLWLTQRDKGKQVPSLVGVNIVQARARVASRGFTLETIRQPGAGSPGTVLDQAPQAGASLEKGSQVMVVVAGGRRRVTVPSVVGQKVADAQQLLSTLGLQSRTSSSKSKQPKGTVVSQDPKPGQQRLRGATVGLVVSSGAAPVKVPALEGMSQSDAMQSIQKAGLVPIVIQVPSQQTKGSVVAQDPAANQAVQTGSKVRINVAAGPASTSTATQTVTTSQTTTRATTTVVTTTTP